MFGGPFDWSYVSVCAFLVLLSDKVPVQLRYFIPQIERKEPNINSSGACD